jgi:DNA invertase Pin-like site-specific DNA recombinase
VTLCPKCGANIALVGRVHNCRPRAHTEKCIEIASSISVQTTPSEAQKPISDNVDIGVCSAQQERGDIMAKAKAKRAAFYVRASSDQQTVENQIRELRRAVEYERWTEVAIYRDEGISGTVERRPGLDAMLEAARRGEFDVVMVWAIDRLGRSVPGLIKTVQLIHKAKVDLFLMRERIDTTTDTGELLFTIMAALASFERKTIRRRADAGIARVKAELADKKMFTARKSGIVRKHLGRPKVEEAKLLRPEKAKAAQAARDMLTAGTGILKVARFTGLGTGTVHRLAKELRGP